MVDNDRSVLVTGCSSGLGKAIAFYLREKGWRVFATARKIEDVERLRLQGFSAFQLDLNSSESINKAVDEVLLASGGMLSAVVNNAGVYQIGAVEDLSRDIIRKDFETNVFGPIELTNRLIPLFYKRKKGKIIFIVHTNNNAFAFPFLSTESASKNALETFCNALRREMKGSGICVTGLAPYHFNTSILRNAVDNFHASGIAEKSKNRSRYQKLMEFLKMSAASKSANSPDLIAKKVYQILESKHPPALCAVPFESALHRWVHRFLPERMLDLVLFLKTRFMHKIP